MKIGSPSYTLLGKRREANPRQLTLTPNFVVSPCGLSLITPLDRPLLTLRLTDMDEDLVRRERLDALPWLRGGDNGGEDDVEAGDCRYGEAERDAESSWLKSARPVVTVGGSNIANPGELLRREGTGVLARGGWDDCTTGSGGTG